MLDHVSCQRFFLTVHCLGLFSDVLSLRVEKKIFMSRANLFDRKFC